MHKIILAAAAVLPLFGSAALAAGGTAGGGGNSYAGHDVDTSIGVTAYPDWQQQWAQLRRDPAAAALLGIVPTVPGYAAQPTAPSATPNG
jgi:hypothetical protein